MSGNILITWSGSVVRCCHLVVGPEDVVEPCESKAEQEVRSGATVASGAGENHPQVIPEQHHQGADIFSGFLDLSESLDEELPADGAEGKSPFTSKVASRRGRNNVGHTDRTSPSSLSGHWAFRVKRPWGLITAPVEDCDGESFLSGSSGEEDCPVTEVLPVDQAEETVPVAEEETVALSEMASGTSESDVGHTERSSPLSSSGHWAFHLKRPRLRKSEHAEDCDVESFRSGMSEEEDCPGREPPRATANGNGVTPKALETGDGKRGIRKLKLQGDGPTGDSENGPVETGRVTS
ncbi:uncharacterized protein LOC130680769 [Manis pentadactyla]|uniref:uncharacterized protein LOC130680769 n=1 Tax=Manis pentadactyla TaxID=143292 RepID=UPI00255C8C42|nr:uncharacterized protein LOC130680769 [Manis pentadactyla]